MHARNHSNIEGRDDDQNGAEDGGNDGEDHVGVDVAGGGLTSSKAPKETRDDEEDAAVDSFTDTSIEVKMEIGLTITFIV